ncbi:hypothetical protein GIB67_011886 [Kingdonia uniflora]|uniref:Chalcone-flavonone isomerase family protein n=1 Tax=Kingdonia uniflora TaxID=39325 RepID=A0A7J7KVS5_9MAGN|nr:hypothetical protein GIB67_011886 [Kingdonia uniflora]
MKQTPGQCVKSELKPNYFVLKAKEKSEGGVNCGVNEVRETKTYVACSNGDQIQDFNPIVKNSLLDKIKKLEEDEIKKADLVDDKTVDSSNTGESEFVRNSYAIFFSTLWIGTGTTFMVEERLSSFPLTFCTKFLYVLVLGNGSCPGEAKEEVWVKEENGEIDLTNIRETWQAETNKNSVQQSGNSKLTNGGKSRRKKQSGKREVVDLRTLLIPCAQSVAADDRRSATDLLKLIRQHASPFGDGNQKLAHSFADRLEACLAGRCGITASIFSGVSVLFMRSPSGTLEIRFSKDSLIPTVQGVMIKNKPLPQAVLESIIGQNGVSPKAKQSLVKRLAKLLQKKHY